MDIGLRLLAVVALVAANGFFVAAEFALVTARKPRIEQLAARGNRAALAVRRAMDDPQRFISAVQLGITAAGLALGWVGENTIAAVIEIPLQAALPQQGLAGIASHVIATPIAFVLTTFVLISLGELAPKMIALQKAEGVALFTITPVSVVGFVFRPFIFLLYRFTDVVLRAFGMRWQAESYQSYSPEDLKLLVQSSRASGAMSPDPERMVERALDFTQLAAHHVMVPRTEMIAVPANVTLDKLAATIARHGHSRYPVYEGSPDNIIGVVSATQLAQALTEHGSEAGNRFDVRRVMSDPLFVPETMRADRLLAQMKQRSSHLAVVVDEYGVTAGLVTLRDLLDRIAGEVRDESDLARPTLERLGNGDVVVDGLALLSDVQAELGIPFGESDFDTLGGYIFGRLGKRPEVGDTIAVDGRSLVVEELDGLRVARVRVQQTVPESEGVTA